MITINQILKLKPEFKFGNMTMIDWFQVTQSGSFCTIRSGLRHADGVTKSPFYFEHSEGGKNAKKECIKHFDEWWNSLEHKI